MTEKLTSHDIKAAVASYWRYTRQYRLVAFEWGGCPGGEMADVVAVDGWQRLIIIEVKTSLSDFRRDKFKWTHRRLREATGLEEVPLPFGPIPVQKISVIEAFYFAVPKELANQVSMLCDELYPYAGVLGCKGIHDYQVEVHRKPRKFQSNALRQEQIDHLIRAQTATLCRLATKAAEEHRERKRWQDLYRQCQKEKEARET